MNMYFERKLPIPMEVKEKYPVPLKLSTIVTKRDIELKKILASQEDKIILIVGPCSADNADSVVDYIMHLKELAKEVEDKIFIIPRVYTNKPRTTGDGYKGMLHQPDPNNKEDMLAGIVKIRELHLRVLQETGFTCADEMLYPENHRYLNDLLGYVAVGARSSEDQQHRLTASGLNVPVGMKNPTGGDLSVMMNSIYAAQNPHTFIYRGWEVHSQGNPYAHGILRGYVNKVGASKPNYHYEDLLLVNKMYKQSGLNNPAIIIDCNHANSGKNPFEQERIVKETLFNCRYNADIAKMVKGFMIESYLEDGNQKPGEGVYGKSITDACIGWAKTEQLIRDIYAILKENDR